MVVLSSALFHSLLHETLWGKRKMGSEQAAAVSRSNHSTEFDVELSWRKKSVFRIDLQDFCSIGYSTDILWYAAF